LAQQVGVESFTEFAAALRPRLKAALVAAVGVERAPDAVAEALAFGWEHWERVHEMDNPGGYLYRVGLSRGRRWRPIRPVFPAPPDGEMPWVEPRLPQALGRLSERQRVAVVLVHCLGWTQEEVADLLKISRGSVQTHVDRGLRRLRASLGVTS
jgi:RNA polymerase sigma-70 factor (ECF subfamily)